MKHTETPWEVTNDTMIFGKCVGGCQKKNDSFQIAEMRGWGHLQYLGTEKAFEIQKANANRIVQGVNSHDELVGYLQTLIDGIASQCDDGLDRFDWMVKQAEHIDKRLKALENARKS